MNFLLKSNLGSCNKMGKNSRMEFLVRSFISVDDMFERGKMNFLKINGNLTRKIQLLGIFLLHK